MNEDRDSISRWMNDVLRRNNWSAEHWARLADVPATSITRFLKHRDTSWPSTRTVMALSKAAGVAPNFGVLTAQGLRIPSIPMEQLLDMDVRELVAQKRWSSISVFGDIPAGCVAMTMTLEVLEASGIFLGDRLIVDPSAQPVRGSLVVISTGDRVSAGAYMPPVVVERRMAPGEPNAWPLDLIEVRGVIRRVDRDYPL
jgi:hypothetical protein